VPQRPTDDAWDDVDPWAMVAAADAAAAAPAAPEAPGALAASPGPAAAAHHEAPVLTGHRPVPAGPRAYRGRIRSLGPLAGLLPAAVLGGLGLVLHRGSTSAARGIGGFALAVLAAPGLLVAGVPLRGGAGLYAVAAAGSALLWMLLGAIAARRATRSPVATWRDFWREWLWLALAVWVGVGLSLVAANFLLGRPAL